MMHFPIKRGAPVACGAPYGIRDILNCEKDYLAEFPRVKDFMERMVARPAYQRAMRSTMPNGVPKV